MHRAILLVLALLPISAVAQGSSADQALLAKMKPLYDTPFQRGLISFDCAIEFDFSKHVKDNFGTIPATSVPMVNLLEPIRYRVFVDMSGATVSAQPKLPDLKAVAHAVEVEESNRQLMQFGLGNWIPHAAGELLPLGPTKYHFDRVADEYHLSLQGDNLDSVLTLDKDLHLVSGVVEKPMHIEMTTTFTDGPNGLVLIAASTNTNHMGTVKYTYTYQTISGFQLPASIILSSPQNQTLRYSLSDCKTQHGIIVKVKPSPQP